MIPANRKQRELKNARPGRWLSTYNTCHASKRPRILIPRTHINAGSVIPASERRGGGKPEASCLDRLDTAGSSGIEMLSKRVRWKS